MDREFLFRTVLLTLVVCVYVVRRFFGPEPKNPKVHSLRMAMVTMVVMGVWSASLIIFAIGIGWFAYRVPFLDADSIRWTGAGLMAVTLPLSAWTRMYDSIGDSFMSHINSGMAASLVSHDLNQGQLMLNPMFLTFLLCDAGAVMLSANALVLATGIAAALMIGVRLRLEYS